jgi:hypothetical protein
VEKYHLVSAVALNAICLMRKKKSLYISYASQQHAKMGYAKTRKEILSIVEKVLSLKWKNL